jgi:hypothetical protein
VTQQRIPVLLCFLLPAVVGCGGGDGAPIDPVDPDAPPVVSDKQPPTITNQNPVNPASVPPDDTQDPPADPSVPVTDPPPAGGGSCVDVCNALPARGCQTPEGGCEEACRPDPMATCSREELALLRCASEVICPEDVQAQLQQVVAHCPNQYDAYRTCVLNSGTD